MATIRMIWNGKDKTSTEVTSNYFQGATSGFFKPPSFSESWTGRNLVYATADSPYPSGGTLTGFSVVKNTGVLNFQISDLNYTIVNGAPFTTTVENMIAGKDEWFGDGGNNFFYASVGGDVYHGGAGIDTVDVSVLSKASYFTASTTVLRNTDGTLRVSNFGTTSLTLDSVERIRFTDVSVAVDLDGNAGKVARVLGAVFGRDTVRNKEYFGIGLNLFDTGSSSTAVMKLALDVKLGAVHSGTDVINLLYKNIANTTPSSMDLQLYNALLTDGFVTQEELALAAADTALNASNVNLVGLAQTGVDYIPVAG